MTSITSISGATYSFIIFYFYYVMVYNFYFSPHPQAFAQQASERNEADSHNGKRQDNKICHKQVIVGVVTLFL